MNYSTCLCQWQCTNVIWLVHVYYSTRNKELLDIFANAIIKYLIVKKRYGSYKQFLKTAARDNYTLDILQEFLHLPLKRYLALGLTDVF